MPRASAGSHWREDGRCERCGLRGYRAGEVGVHERQALVLINYGSGSAAQLLALCEHIQSAVEQRFGVCLEVEPRIYGSF